VNDHPSRQRPPHHSSGPFESRREAADAAAHITDSPPGAWADGNLRLLEGACRAAGVDVGALDYQILVWLAGWEPSTVTVIAGLITRAGEHTDLSGVAQPGGGWISGPST